MAQSFAFWILPLWFSAVTNLPTYLLTNLLTWWFFLGGDSLWKPAKAGIISAIAKKCLPELSLGQLTPEMMMVNPSPQDIWNLWLDFRSILISETDGLFSEMMKVAALPGNATSSRLPRAKPARKLGKHWVILERRAMRLPPTWGVHRTSRDLRRTPRDLRRKSRKQTRALRRMFPTAKHQTHPWWMLLRLVRSFRRKVFPLRVGFLQWAHLPQRRLHRRPEAGGWVSEPLRLSSIKISCGSTIGILSIEPILVVSLVASILEF